MMKSITFTCLIYVLAVTCNCREVFGLTSDLSQYNIVRTSQSRNSGESMPCGGGDIGLNAWVENGEILFYLSRNDPFDENNVSPKFGRVRLKLMPNPLDGGEFRQALDGEGRGSLSSILHPGLTDEAAAITIKKLQDSCRRFPTFWGPGHDWVLTITGGSGMIGLQEMLMQTDGKKIYLFPAWPENWDVVFKLHAPYNTVLEGIFKGGQVIKLNVTPEGKKRR